MSVVEALEQVPATRLIHFAPATNVTGIFTDNAIRTSQDLVENAPQQFSPTDELRLDARNNHVCCSFEYPNAYYQAIARDKSAFRNYPDWVAFVLDLDLVLRPGTLFSPCNAAKGGGAFLTQGGSGAAGLLVGPFLSGRVYKVAGSYEFGADRPAERGLDSGSCSIVSSDCHSYCNSREGARVICTAA
ncbi:DarT ssDNA thymidine ADP-ribosyltransferase family protein [Arthrobacter sp. KNU40]|uniref:DarT ssDNA thymidine ADP-ribosyltransferase family protein n=1 Tax=Arthrobacter sp. KNU40 TaxID=3447965 RepID=UPI003F638822